MTNEERNRANTFSNGLKVFILFVIFCIIMGILIGWMLVRTNPPF